MFYCGENITNSHVLLANIHDSILHDTQLKLCYIIDVSVPVDKNSVKQNRWKITKCRDLEKFWVLKKVKRVPIVIGAQGTVCSGLTENLKLLSSCVKLSVIQKSSIRYSTHP